jgi:hypothetical protein
MGGEQVKRSRKLIVFAVVVASVVIQTGTALAGSSWY